VLDRTLRTVIVTSQLTYVQGNYQALFEELLSTASDCVAGVIFLQNLDSKTFRSVLGLGYLGAYRVQRLLLSNIAKLPFKRREQLISKYKIPCATFGSMNDQEAIDWIKELRANLVVNARTRCIYKSKILESVPLGCVNIHHGLLPKYRGTMCDLYALSEGREAGFSIHKMNNKIDAGEIFKTQVTSPGDEKNYIAHLERGAMVEGRVLGEWLNSVNSLQSLPQGTPNQAQDIVFSKNPSRSRVQKMKRNGMIV